jgi:hypothetical protein
VTLLLPDLVVTVATAPATISWGEAITLTWTVTNQGDVEAAASSWYDYVYLSEDDQLSTTGDNTYLTHFSRNNASALAVGSTYTAQGTAIYNEPRSGDFYLLFVTDYYYNYQIEKSESNNVRSVAVHINEGPDLTVTAASAPDKISWGETIALTWTVTNQATSAALASYWYDYVYLSVDNQLDTTGDNTSLTYFGRDNSSALAANGTYTAQITYTYNQVLSGDFYLLFVTDYNGYEHGNHGA